MVAADGQEIPIRLFYSYSHRDEELRKTFENHLAALRWSGMIAEWHDRNIDVGDEWAKEMLPLLDVLHRALTIESANVMRVSEPETQNGRERKQERVPFRWAETQNNLGATLRLLGERGNDTEQIRQVVEASPPMEQCQQDYNAIGSASTRVVKAPGTAAL